MPIVSGYRCAISRGHLHGLSLAWIWRGGRLQGVSLMFGVVFSLNAMLCSCASLVVWALFPSSCLICYANRLIGEPAASLPPHFRSATCPTQVQVTFSYPNPPRSCLVSLPNPT